MQNTFQLWVEELPKLTYAAYARNPSFTTCHHTSDSRPFFASYTVSIIRQTVIPPFQGCLVQKIHSK